MDMAQLEALPEGSTVLLTNDDSEWKRLAGDLWQRTDDEQVKIRSRFFVGAVNNAQVVSADEAPPRAGRLYIGGTWDLIAIEPKEGDRQGRWMYFYLDKTTHLYCKTSFPSRATFHRGRAADPQPDWVQPVYQALLLMRAQVNEVNRLETVTNDEVARLTMVANEAIAVSRNYQRRLEQMDGLRRSLREFIQVEDNAAKAADPF